MRFNKTMWAVQGLLAALFLFAGGMKLVMPIEAMQGPITLPAGFLRFIGVAEVLGGLGLVLPGALRIRVGLTPLAASGLVVIMAGAVTLTGIAMGLSAAAMPFVVGTLLTLVVYRRTRQIYAAI